MQILVFEPDPLVGEDLRDSARAAGAKVQYVRDARGATSVLKRNGRGVIAVLSGRSISRHQAALTPVFGEMETRVVLFGVGDRIPPQVLPEAVLPDPFTDSDVRDVLTSLLPKS